MFSSAASATPSLVAVERPETTASIRTHSDPNIFRNDRVLRMLLKREASRCGMAQTQTGLKGGYFGLQSELRPAMRREVASWMLEVCEEEGASTQVFCLAVSYLDRFLASCKIAKSQLQLLGAVCLLVSWKVRDHSPITAQRLIEYTDYNVDLAALLEWEFLLLSKLDWDLSAVLAPDYTEHVLQRLLKLDLAWNIDITRTKVDTLVTLCYCHPSLASLPPSLLAVSSIMTALRPALEAAVSVTRDTPSPSSGSGHSSAHSSPSAPPPAPASPALGSVDLVLGAMGRLAVADRAEVMEVVARLEQLMQASLPPSPAQSDEERSPAGGQDQPPAASASRLLASSPLAPRTLFTDPEAI